MSGRILAQSDWEVSYSEGDGKFWITYKCSGQPSVHSHILCEKDRNGQIRLTSEHPSFHILQHSSSRFKVSYIENGQTLATTTFKAPARQYLNHGKNVKVTCLDVSAGGLGLSSTENSSNIKIWETTTGAVRRELTGHAGDIYRAKFFPSGVVVLSGGADTQLKIWSAETGDCAATIIGHRAGVLDLDFVDKGRNIVSCSRDGSAKLWDVSKQRCIHTYSSDELGIAVVNGCALNNTAAVDLQEESAPTTEDSEVGTRGKLLLLALESGKMVGYGLASKQQILEVVPPEMSAVNCVSFVTDDTAVIGTDGGAVVVYDLRNLSVPVKSWNESRSAILCLRRCKQGFLYSSGDGSVVYIDETLTQSYEMTGADCDPVYQVCYDGSNVYTSCRDSVIRVYS